MSVEFTASPYFTQASETGRDGHTVETFRILVEEFDDLQMFATGARLRAGQNRLLQACRYRHKIATETPQTQRRRKQ